MPSARLRNPRGPLASTTNAGANADGAAAPRAAQHRTPSGCQSMRSSSTSIEILDAERDRLAHQKVIDVAAQPVRVGQLVVRARGHEQLIRAIGVRSIAPSGLVLEVGEAALQPADDVRIRALPRAERRERPQARQVVAIGRAAR